MKNSFKVGYLFLFCIFFSGTVRSQLPNDFSFMTAFTIAETSYENYTWSECIDDYPEFGLSNDQFSTYSVYGRPGSFEGGQVFFNSLSIELGKGISHSKINFLNRSSHRFRITVEGTPVYSNNMEHTEYIGTSLNSNPVMNRDFYEVYMQGTFLYFTYGIHHFSNYRGKNDNMRLWIGLSVIQGIVWSNIYLTHTSGIYERKENEYSGYGYYPYGFSSPQKVESKFEESRWMNGFTIPFGIEWELGKRKRKRSALGMYYTFGNSWLVLFGKSTMSTSVFSGGINFRFKIESDY